MMVLLCRLRRSRAHSTGTWARGSRSRWGPCRCSPGPRNSSPPSRRGLSKMGATRPHPHHPQQRRQPNQLDSCNLSPIHPSHQARRRSTQICVSSLFVVHFSSFLRTFHKSHKMKYFSGSCHKRQKPRAPTPQAPVRNRQTRKVADAKGLNRNTNLT